jgi:Cu(I)/Ag(I) efflux system periplasmic protein CusF
MKSKALISASLLVLAAMTPAAQSATAEHDHGTMAGMHATKQEAGHQASGVVKKTDAATNTATIAHGAVKDLNWPPMTMKFKVKDKALLSQLQVDKKIDFTFVQEGNNYVIISAR